MTDDDLVPDDAIDTAWRETASCQWYSTSGGTNQPRDAVAYILRRAAPHIVAPWRKRVAELDELAREHCEESERQFDRGGIQRDRAEAAEALIAQVWTLLDQEPEPPRLWNDVARSIWASGWFAATREIGRVLRPANSQPAPNSAQPGRSPAEEGGAEDCVFCNIVSGKAPAEVLGATAQTITIRPLNPATEGHVLVIPRDHHAGVLDCPKDIWAAVMAEAHSVARRWNAMFVLDGFNIIQSTGAAATQTVMHLHVHVVPRYAGDAMGQIWPAPQP